MSKDKKTMNARHHLKERRMTHLKKFMVALLLLGAYFVFFRASVSHNSQPSSTPVADLAPVPHATATLFASGELPDACTYRNFTNDATAHKEHLHSLLSYILSFGPRVGGSSSKGYFGVLKALIAMMQCSSSRANDEQLPEWELSFDNFTEATPVGMMQFTNLISTIENPFFQNGDAEPIDRSKRRHFPKSKGKKRLSHLVLAAHWDSKLMKGSKPFLGACDSVVPMLIVLEMMKMVSHTLRMAASGDMYHHSVARNLLPQTVTVMLFDGEEAFVHWQGKDHTYGSRHLASHWQQTNKISSIDLFALLDLMGPAGLTYHNYFPNESGAFFDSLSVTEKRLRSRGRLLTTHTSFPSASQRQPPIEDDHIHWAPYVPVLHMISNPFPRVWHTSADDESAIDLATTIDLLHIIAHGLVGFPLR
ncbi:peptidase, putative [Bodo saltans]|uniref:Peptidase, putative n=1 Tax=Bodo saltans TaxID=75058 RepID=A0A0S4IP93_BODSA|nr:peptidase, putative [Bodo saltans]|eukprot:CUF01735.1 peptidase, putative [Bodo saltans]